MIDSLFGGVAFKRVNFRFGLEASDVQIKFINIFHYPYIFLIRLVDEFLLSFPFNPIPVYISESTLAVLKSQSGSSAATIANSKILFSAVSFSGVTRLIGKFAFELFLFYPDQYRFLGGPILGGILEKPLDISRLLEDGSN